MTHPPPRRTRTLAVSALARVEGEGALTIRTRRGRVVGAELRIYEAPRLFEALLRGRDAADAPDVTARICGICPVAYQMSAVAAVEQAFGVFVAPAAAMLRRLLYCGEWIASHALHVHFLHAPDFLGHDGALAMAQASPELAAVVRRGLRLKQAGSAIMTLVGGRDVHPVSPCVGGFHAVPRVAAVRALRDPLRRALDDAVATVAWAAGLDIPDVAVAHEWMALRHPDEYPICSGRLATTGGLDAPVEAFLDHVEEVQVPWSTALHARRRGRDVVHATGPLARWNLNAAVATPRAREAAAAAHLPVPCTNPALGIVVRAVEMVVALEEAVRLVETWEPPLAPAVGWTPRAGVGHAVTEAPRGLLYHRYVIDDVGRIVEARIVPPTSQNQEAIEADLRQAAAGFVALPQDEAVLAAEKVIRHWDPCISCATHFLRLRVEEAR